MASDIARQDNVSGELFDLSIPSLNNSFGYEHIMYTIRYGISPPLEKYMEELEAIVDGPQDDKTEKRQQRLQFLYHCFESREIQDFFRIYCNYINGGGTIHSPHWFNRQYPSIFVLTVAGGNIITVFAQLLTNILDSYTKAVNNEVEPADYEWEEWDLYDDDYEREEFFNDDARDIRDGMFTTNFRDWTPDYWRLINTTYELLTPSNKKIIDELENYSQFSKELICFLICSHILNNDHDRTVENDVRGVAEAPHSDFDFKLSPNIDPDILDESKPDYDVQTFIDELSDSIPEDSHAGFMLLRAKSLIICKSRAQVPNYSNDDIKRFKRDCAAKMGNWVYSLFPQTMQRDYLQRVTPNSDCWKFLNFLLQKKILIGDATRNNIDEILKFYMSGYHQAEDRNGRAYHPIPTQPNSTEAIIEYLHHVTFHLNVYINRWETDKLSRNSAPGLFMNGPRVVEPRDYSYRTICFSFLTLDSLLHSNNCFVGRLGSDILNYFLNNPEFQTEAILDSLIKSVNNQRRRIDPRSWAYMPPSDLVLAPTHPSFSRSLRTLKDILENSRYSELGYPDGLRLTINAIRTDSRLPDTRLDQMSDEAMAAAGSDRNIMSEFVQFRSKGAPGTSGRAKKTRKKKYKLKKKYKSKKMKRKLKKAIKNTILLNRSIKILRKNAKRNKNKCKNMKGKTLKKCRKIKLKKCCTRKK